MSEWNHSRGAGRIADLCRAASILLLLLHFYASCYALFAGWGLRTDLGDGILRSIAKTGLFNGAGRIKLVVLLLLGLSFFGGRGRKDLRVNLRSCGWIILAGMLLYSRSPDQVSRSLPAGWGIATVVFVYISMAIAGYILVMIGGARLARILPSPFRREDPFGKEQSGFPQEERKLVSDLSINLPAGYLWKGQERDSWINIVNPRRGVLIIGSPGSGKSRFIIEPIMRQLMEKGMALFIYDFKYDTLTRQAFHLFQANWDKYPPGAAFYSINFSDLARSHRCNLLEPATLEWLADAIGASRTLLLSLNKTWIHKQGEFFVESPVNFLAALIWFLRRYKDGIFCTLPHVIELAQVPYAKLFSILRTEPEIEVLINPFVDAYQRGAKDMLEGQIASARIPLGRLSSPDLYYILTGHDCSLDINDPAAPKIICLGGDPPRQEALAPVLSLYIDRMNKLVNRPGRHPCALICDEFATVRAYSMTTTIATARSNDIVPVLAIQDLSQLRTQYSRDEADLILNISGNLLCGQVGGETARWVSERFPKVWQDRMSISTNSNDTSISHSRQWETAITPATVATLSSGEFLGIVADDPGQLIELKAFHGRLRREEPKPTGDGPLPVVRVVDPAGILKQFGQVRQDILGMVDKERERMMRDSSLKGLILE